MKNNNLTLVLIIFIVIVSCKSNNKESYKPINDSLKNQNISNINTSFFDNKNKPRNDSLIRCPCQPLISIKELKKKVRRGDDSAYRQLYIANLSNRDNQLFWAFYMANRYNYPKAFYDVYYCLMISYGCNDDYTLKNMDKKTKKIAIEYLLLAAEKGYDHAIDIINEYHPNLKKELTIKQKK